MNCDGEFMVGFAFGAMVAAGVLIMFAVAVCVAVFTRPRRFKISETPPRSEIDP